MIFFSTNWNKRLGPKDSVGTYLDIIDLYIDPLVGSLYYWYSGLSPGDDTEQVCYYYSSLR